MIRAMRVDDIAQVAGLAQVRREEDSIYQPQFWRVAEGAVEAHTSFLAMLVEDAAVVTVVAVDGNDVLGFAIGRVVPAPPVYNPGGPSGRIDDFVVREPGCWDTVGAELLAHARQALASLGAAQIVVVCGQRDDPKRRALLAQGLSVASEWFVGPV